MKSSSNRAMMAITSTLYKGEVTLTVSGKVRVEPHVCVLINF